MADTVLNVPDFAAKLIHARDRSGVLRLPDAARHWGRTRHRPAGLGHRQCAAGLRATGYDQRFPDSARAR